MTYDPEDATGRLHLPYLAAGQMQKHVTLNEALTRIDALVQTSVVSRSQAAQPASAADGQMWLLPPDRSGAAWAAYAPGDLVRFDAGGWTSVEAPDGLIAHIVDEAVLVIRDGGQWRPIAELFKEVHNLARLGINTSADAANPFAARLNKALWTALSAADGGDGDLRITLNKETEADVLSVLFQTNWGGRAELGLIGSDDLSLKVSADGAEWRDVLAIDRTTGRASFSRGSLRSETAILGADGDYPVPPWARRLKIVCVGAGGGGGSGGAGNSAANRCGGGGGGAGGVTEVELDAAGIGPLLSVIVGGGGLAAAAVVGAGSGAAGGDGGASGVLDGGLYLVEATGGAGGSGGDVSGPGGPGGRANTGHANGGGAGLATADGLPGETGTLPAGSGGGGGGGGVQTSGVQHSGGVGGYGYIIGQSDRRSASGSGGAPATAGGPGASKACPEGFGGGGGGGGAGDAAQPAGPGGAGGFPGGGGGGGGAGRDTSSSGAGGPGGGGEVRITAIG